MLLNVERGAQGLKLSGCSLGIFGVCNTGLWILRVGRRGMWSRSGIGG